jgi:hypothetical protein
MQHTHDEIFERIEAAISGWTQTVANAHENLSGHLERARHRIETQTEPPNSGFGGLDEISRGLNEYNVVAKSATERLAGVIQSLTTLNNGRSISATAAGNEALAHELNTLRNEFMAIKESLAGLPLLAFKVDEIRDLLFERQARKTAVAQPSPPINESTDNLTLRTLLEQASAERQQAHEEIVNLRAEVDLLRRANASLCVANAGESDGAEIEAVDANGKKRRMGMVLVDARIISHEQLDEALNEQLENPHKRLGAILVERGFTSEAVIARVLAGQLRLPLVDLKTEPIDPGAARLISKKVAMHNLCIPIRAEHRSVTLVMANPLDLIAIEDVEMMANRQVEPAISTPTSIAEAIERVFQ